jgi:UDP-glucose 4-epimerase
MILVTGGAGYIGSHTCVALAQAGRQFVIADNFSNSDPGVADRLERLIGYAPIVLQGDVRDEAFLDRIFDDYAISAVIHFAGLKSVAESVRQPVDYFSNNVAGSLSVVQAMARANCRMLVFSSSATVYGDGKPLPLREDTPRSVTNPYGRSKLMVEEMLEDLHASDPSWRIARLRYFNPAGAHESGLIGESPKGTPNNLMPYVVQVAAGRMAILRVFGNDYPTPDGTGVRDFIHVMDLAEGHVAALAYLAENERSVALNLGTGKGTSVLEMIASLQRVSGRRIAYEIAQRRAGDVATSFADVALAQRTLGWTAKRDIDQICRDAWKWHVSSQGAPGE